MPEQTRQALIKYLSATLTPTIAVVSLSLSIVTFLLQSCTINSLTYTVEYRGQFLGLKNDAKQKYLYAETPVTFYNNGNRPVVVNMVSNYVMSGFSENKISWHDADCEEKAGIQHREVFLAEDLNNIPKLPTGTATEGIYGSRLIAPQIIPAYQAFVVDYRVSMFGPVGPQPEEINGLFCVGVTVTNIKGVRVSSTAAIVVLHHLKRGQDMSALTNDEFMHLVEILGGQLTSRLLF